MENSLPVEGRPQVPRDDPRIGRTGLLQLVARAAAEHQSFSVSADDFVAYVLARLHAGNIDEQLATLRAGDLYLCCGCLSGLPAALGSFEPKFARTVKPVLTRMGLGSADREDLAQQLRIKLLVGAASGPALARYSGHGSLTGWIRAAAVRTALDFLRRAEPPTRELDWAEWTAVCGDPEVGHLKRAYREVFARAASDALAALSERARLLLKQHLLDGLSIARVAALHGVHVATMYRWLDAARAELIAETRRRLAASLKVDSRDVETLVGLLQSELSLSVRRLLEPS